MATLTNLEGLSVKEIECLFIEKASDIRIILNNCKAATTADSNGAINVWKDDDDKIRCSRHRYLAETDSQIFDTMEEAIKWTAKALRKIK